MADQNTTMVCTGGPLDGTEVTIRSPEGFLAVDQATGRAWMYKRRGDTFGVCTDHDDSLIYPQGATTGERRLDEARVWQAGEASALDIIAVGD